MPTLVRSYVLTFLVGLALLSPSSAESTILSQEIALENSENQVGVVSEVLESWLSGRLKQDSALNRLRDTESRLTETPGLPRDVGKPIQATVRKMFSLSLEFVSRKNPDSRGQRVLFRELNRLTLSRNQAINSWRTSSLQKRAGSPAIQKWRTWELAWLDIWKRESKLTYTLQACMLKEKGQGRSEIQGLVKQLLKLRLDANSVPSDGAIKKLQALSLERLVLLARTADQVSRLDSGKSRGSVTRVRRLSRKLNAVSKEFRRARLAYLRTIL